MFAVIVGGMFVQLGPTVGALFTLSLAKMLRVTIGHDVHGLDGTIYGLLLILFIIDMPQGILGRLLDIVGLRYVRVKETGEAMSKGDPLAE